MDGVLANLYDYMSVKMFQQKYENLNPIQKDIFKTYFREKMYFNHTFPEGVEGVFGNLNPFPFNETLIKLVSEYAGEYVILSRPCALDVEGSKRAKIKWVKKHLAFCPPKDVLIVQDKSANGRAKGNILIDDWDPFLVRWKEKGGVAIKFKATDYEDELSLRDYITSRLKEH